MIDVALGIVSEWLQFSEASVPTLLAALPSPPPTMPVGVEIFDENTTPWLALRSAPKHIGAQQPALCLLQAQPLVLDQFARRDATSGMHGGTLSLAACVVVQDVLTAHGKGYAHRVTRCVVDSLGSLFHSSAGRAARSAQHVTLTECLNVTLAVPEERLGDLPILTAVLFDVRFRATANLLTL